MTPRGRPPSDPNYEMRIADSQQAPDASWTKCSKMTEEGHRRHGMNGSADGGTVVPKEECPRSAYNQGGRLKFFKDGKFILELERAREGERVSWVSVPRKTYWPPQGNAASTPTYRQESSTSLSDDNSSIQSSPWQRDHSWKQATPRRNLSKEMTFYYCRRRMLHPAKRSRKRRRPYAASPNPVDSSSVSAKSDRTEKNSACNKVTNRPRVRHSVLTVVQMLIDKSASSTPPRAEVVVSPRKRFLREMEKDKQQVDDACQKRSRSKTQAVSVASSIAAGASPAPLKVDSPVRLNGTTDEARAPRNCSYSITSLLAEDRTSRRSPEDSPSHFSPVTQAQYCSPPSEDRWYSESVDRLRSIELSQVDKRTLSAYSPYPYMPPYVYSYSLPPYYSPGMYGRSYMVPPVYPTPPMPVPVRHDAPSCSWTADTPKDVEHRDDNIADMPLNLSKHAG